MTAVAITAGAAALDDALDGLPEAMRARALRAERVTQLALSAAGGALADAGLATTDGPPRPDIGIVLGTAFGCFLTNAAYQRRLAAEGARGASPRLFAATVSNAAAGEVGIAYRLGGPAITLTAGSAAGLLAIGHAADLVATGRAAAIVAGGMDARGPALERWLADGGLRSGEAPVGDGAAVVVVQHAPLADQPRLGMVLGHGAGFTSATDGDDAGLRAAVGQALDGAGLRAADVAFVVVEGTPPAPDDLRRALGTAVAPRVRTPRAHAGSLAAAGPLALLAALADAPAGRPFLVLHACVSGHVATLIAARGGSA